MSILISKNKKLIRVGQDYSAGDNIGINDYVISSRNWTPDITYTSESAYQRATNYTDTQISALSGEVSAEVSHLSSDIDYISGVALTSHQSLEGYLTKASGDEYYQPIGSYATVSQLESTSGDITALIPDTSNFITNSSAEATYQPIGNYLSSNALEGYATNESLDTASSFLSGAIDYVSANVGENIPVSNSGDLYKVGFDGVDLYGYKSTSSIPYHVYSAVSSTNEKSINNPSEHPWFDNDPFVGSLNNWSAFDIISISSNGEKIYPPGQPKPYEGVTALDVYYKASYLYDYNNQLLPGFSGYIGKITHDSLVVTSYFDKPSYFNNIARCSNFMLWFSADKRNGQPLLNNKYVCSVGNKVESGTSKVEGIIVPGTVDLSNYYTKSETSGASEIADALANIPTGNPEVESYVQTNSGTIDDVNTSYQTNSGTFLTAHQDLSDYYTTADANTLSSMLSGAIDYVSANAGKVYEGVSPIVVNNTEDKISADTWTFSAGSNVSFVDDNVNKITRIDCTVTGYNETVLWSGNALTGTLNESPWNFEKLGFETSGSINSLQYNEFPAISGKNMMAMTTIGPESNSVWHFTPSQISFNGNTFTLKSCDFYARTNQTTFTWNDGDHIRMIKIIGINRKY